MTLALGEFFDEQMKKGGRFVPARLQAALALLEKLRESPSLNLNDHLASKGSSGLESHETYGNRVHERMGIEAINKNHGRRSSSLQDWGQDLLDELRAAGFDRAAPAMRDALIGEAQELFAAILRGIIQQGPLEVRISGRTAEAVVRDVLKLADEKNKAGDVAQYLVGAKLMLRFNREIPVLPVNKGDRKSRTDTHARSGDFEIENAVIEVAVGLPDEKHLDQIAQILEDSDSEVWLLARKDRVEAWRTEIDSSGEIDKRRLVIASVEAFIGQNISELGEFSSKGKVAKLRSLFDLYNEVWVKKLGPPGIRIIVK